MISNSITPAFTLPSSTKFVSVVSVKLNLVSVNVNFNLSAPGAFSFVVPCELSNSDESDDDLEVTSDSSDEESYNQEN